MAVAPYSFYGQIRTAIDIPFGGLGEVSISIGLISGSIKMKVYFLIFILSCSLVSNNKEGAKAKKRRQKYKTVDSQEISR